MKRKTIIERINRIAAELAAIEDAGRACYARSYPGEPDKRGENAFLVGYLGAAVKSADHVLRQLVSELIRHTN